MGNSAIKLEKPPGGYPSSDRAFYTDQQNPTINMTTQGIRGPTWKYKAPISILKDQPAASFIPYNPDWHIMIQRGKNAQYSNSKQQIFLIDRESHDIKKYSGSSICAYYDYNSGYTSWFLYYAPYNTTLAEFQSALDMIPFKNDVKEIYFFTDTTTTNIYRNAFIDGNNNNISSTTFLLGLADTYFKNVSTFFLHYDPDFSSQWGTVLRNIHFKQNKKIPIYCISFRPIDKKSAGPDSYHTTTSLIDGITYHSTGVYAQSGVDLPIINLSPINPVVEAIVGPELNSPDAWSMGYGNITGMTHDASYIYIVNNSSKISTGVDGTSSISRISFTNPSYDICYNWINDVNYAFGIVFDGTNNLYISNYGNPFSSPGGDLDLTQGTISKFTIHNGNITEYILGWATELYGPAALVYDDNYLYVTELGKHIVSNIPTLKIDYYSGTTIRRISTTSPSNIITLATDLSGPIGLVINNNILYVSNYNNNTISKIDMNTNITTSAWSTLTNKPRGLSIYDNYLFVTNGSNVSVISLDDGNIIKNDYIVDNNNIPLSLTIKDDIGYVANEYDIVRYKANLTVSNICFIEDTPILTDQGYIPINKILPNVNTIHNKKIVDITRTTSVDDYLVCFDKDAIMKGYPTEKTIMSKNHKVFYQGMLKEAYTFVPKFKKIYKVKYNGEILYNILMEEYTTIRANNLICETLDPNNLIAKLDTCQCKYTEEERKMIINLLQDSIRNKDRLRYNKIAKNIK